jgi:hypothetical protein
VPTPGLFFAHFFSTRYRTSLIKIQEPWTSYQGVTKRLRQSLLTNSALSPNARGGGGVAGSQPVSTAVHITWHGAQINIGDPPTHLTYDFIPFRDKNVVSSKDDIETHPSFSLSVSGKKANGVPRSNSLGCGSLTPPTVRKSRLHALGRLFKPWKWKRKRKSDKFEAASKSKFFSGRPCLKESVFLLDASKRFFFRSRPRPKVSFFEFKVDSKSKFF